MILLIFLVTGALAGLLAGLFGIGGGLVVVPALLLVFRWHEVPLSVAMHLAVGTSLAVMIVSSTSSVVAHHRRGAVQWDLFKRMCSGVVIGAIIGVVIDHFLPGKILHIVFGVVVLLIAIQLGFNLKPKKKESMPGTTLLFSAGVGSGTLSSLLGIGGGTFNVPLFNWWGLEMKQAVATAASLTLPVAIVGTIGFVIIGLGKPNLPPWSSGFVNWSAMLGIAIGSMFLAPLGARLAHALPNVILRRSFAVFLVIVASLMLFD